MRSYSEPQVFIGVLGACACNRDQAAFLPPPPPRPGYEASSKSVYSVYPRTVYSDDFHIFQEFEGSYDGWLVMGAVVLNSITRLVNSTRVF